MVIYALCEAKLPVSDGYFQFFWEQLFCEMAHFSFFFFAIGIFSLPLVGKQMEYIFYQGWHSSILKRKH